MIYVFQLMTKFPARIERFQKSISIADCLAGAPFTQVRVQTLELDSIREGVPI